MKFIKRCNVGDLNLETRDYLQRIWRVRGTDHPGIFIKRQHFWLSVVGCLTGLLLLQAAWLGLKPDLLYRSLTTQCILTTLGVVCLTSSIPTLCRRFRHDFLGNFAYFDGSWYWEVGTHRVKITTLTQVLGLQLVDHLTNGVRTKTVANINLPENERISLTFASQSTAQRFAALLQICQGIRRQAALGQLSPSVSQFVSEPGGLAQAARFILDTGGWDLSLARQKLIPIPNPAPLRASPVGIERLGWQAVIGLGLFVAGWFTFPPLHYAIDHNHHYEMVKRSVATSTQAPRAYLAKFPTGRYREEVTAILDDRLFSMAASKAETRHSPAAIRDYLAGEPNQRHQAEARGIIGQFYDEAIARLQQLAAGQPTDQPLLGGLLAILEHLKTQETPRVAVAFQPSWTGEPDNESLKQMEQHFQSAYAEKDAVIERMVRTKRGAIIGTGDTFSEIQVQRRESVILTRLRAAVSNILSSEIIAFETPGNQTGDITIQYEIKPRGTLRKYVRLPDEAPENQTAALLSQPRTTNTLGLLRNYTIDWRLTIQPGSTGTSYDYTLNSNSGTNLVYRVSPGDPDWAVYAVMMYSAFYDFSNRMLSGAGLRPPPAPTTFTFHEAIDR